MPNTIDNLQEAFSGESQASRKYLYFAEAADNEGLSQVARLFRAASEAETIHARNHLNAMNGIGTTADNLKMAIEGEHQEFTEMYPEFIEKSKAENNKKAEISFNFANQVEEIHHTLYEKTLKQLDSGQQIEDKPIYVCEICGNTVEGDAPDKCPVCGAPKTKFKPIS